VIKTKRSSGSKMGSNKIDLLARMFYDPVSKTYRVVIESTRQFRTERDVEQHFEQILKALRRNVFIIHTEENDAGL